MLADFFWRFYDLRKKAGKPAFPSGRVWLGVLPERVERRQDMRERRPSVDSLFAFWRELSLQEQLVLVDSDMRPSLKAFLRRLNFIPKGWEVLTSVAPTLESVGDLGLVWPWEGNMVKANLGLDDMRFVLENWEKIPIEMRSCYIVFSGATLRDFHGLFRVPYLRWEYGRWDKEFGFDNGDCRIWAHDRVRLARRKVAA